MYLFVECPKKCPKKGGKVCASDGMTYPNTCIVKALNCKMSPVNSVQVVTKGSCPEGKIAFPFLSISQNDISCFHTKQFLIFDSI